MNLQYSTLHPMQQGVRWCANSLCFAVYSMKHDAIVEQGIPILERVPIPDDMIPDDSRVEIDAKIHAG
jgi:hypothetical protein